jgi:glutamine amidotransferase-like uncharacterized protein
MFLLLLATVATTVFCLSSVGTETPGIETEIRSKLIGIYTGNGADPYLCAIAKRMFEWMGFKTVTLKFGDLNIGDFKGIHLLYFPGGSTPPFRREITETGRQNLREYIRQGCAYIGTCAGALIACEKNLWLNRPDDYGLFGLVPVTGIGPIPEIDDGDGITMVHLVVNTATEIGEKHPEPATVLSINSPFFEVGESETVTIIAEYEAIHQPAYIATTYGNGRIFLTGPHPEFEEDSNRDGNAYFDGFDDEGSDWPLMKTAVLWCLRILTSE